MGINTVLAWIALGCVLKFGDAALTWSTPVSTNPTGTGTLSLAEDQALTTTIATYVAVSAADTVGDYRLVTIGTPFAVSIGGILTITSPLDFETTSSYSLIIEGKDDEPSTGSITIAVTVTDVNEDPTFAKSVYGFSLAQGAAVGTTVFSHTATDQDANDVITYSIAAGNGADHFEMSDTSTGVIKVKTGATIDSNTVAGYALQIEAADDDTPSLTGTTTLVMLVSSGSAILLAGCSLILFTAFSAVLV